jgi:hypothetical protein
VVFAHRNAVVVGEAHPTLATVTAPILSYSPSDRAPPNPVVWWVTRGIAFGIFIGVLIASFLGTRKPGTQDSDFGAYYRAGVAVDAGRTPYYLDPTHGGPTGAYMYAPVFADYPFRWLSRLHYLWAVRVFMAINWIATGFVVWLCLRFVPPKVDRFAAGSIAMASAGTYLWADIHNGQVGTLLLLACLLWMTLTLAGRSFWGGIVLSMAIALKLYPALLVPYLILQRDVRGLLGVVVGLVLLVGLPAFTVGPTQVIPIHRDWLKFCVNTQTTDQTVRSGNQSLLGVLARTPWVAGTSQRLDPAEMKRAAGPVATLQKIYPVVVIVGTGLVYSMIIFRRLRISRGGITVARVSNPWVWFERPGHGLEARATSARSPFADTDVIFDVAILLLWMTLASPRCWTFNLCNEFPAAVLLAACVVTLSRGWALALTALVGILIGIGLPTNSFHYPNHGWALWAFVVQNKHFDAAVFLMGVLMMLGWWRHGPKEEPDPGVF